MRFSSKLPPRTEYCELISLLEETPGNVFSIASIPPEIEGEIEALRGSSLTKLSVLNRSSLTSKPGRSVEIDCN